MPSTSKSTYSIRTLRNLILVALALGVAGYSATMFSYSRRVLDRLGPQVQGDLEWRAQRGAQELARACDVGLVGYEMTLLVSRTENALTPQLITEMRQNLPIDGQMRS